MSIFISPGTRSAKKELIEICGESVLNKFVNADFKRIFQKTSTVSNVSEFFMNINGRTNKVIENFARALDNDDNMQYFFEAIEKQAKSLGTKKSGLFYRLIYNNIHQQIKSNRNIGVDMLKKFEKELRKFLLAKKGQDIEETELPEGLDKLSDDEKTDKQNRRKNNSNIIEKLKSGRLSNRLKVFMALVLWKYVTNKIKTLNQQQSYSTTADESKVGTESETKEESQRESESGSESGSEDESKVGTESETKEESQRESESGSEIRPEDESKVGTESETKEEGQRESESGSENETDTNAKSESESGSESESEDESEVEAESGSESEDKKKDMEPKEILIKIKQKVINKLTLKYKEADFPEIKQLSIVGWFSSDYPPDPYSFLPCKDSSTGLVFQKVESLPIMEFTIAFKRSNYSYEIDYQHKKYIIENIDNIVEDIVREIDKDVKLKKRVECKKLTKSVFDKLDEIGCYRPRTVDFGIEFGTKTEDWKKIDLHNEGQKCRFLYNLGDGDFKIKIDFNEYQKFINQPENKYNANDQIALEIATYIGSYTLYKLTEDVKKEIEKCVETMITEEDQKHYKSQGWLSWMERPKNRNRLTHFLALSPYFDISRDHSSFSKEQYFKYDISRFDDYPYFMHVTLKCTLSPEERRNFNIEKIAKQIVDVYIDEAKKLFENY